MINDSGNKRIFRGNPGSRMKENLDSAMCPQTTDVTHRPQLPPRPEGRASQSLRYVSNYSGDAKTSPDPSTPVPGISCISLSPSVSHSTFGSASCEDDFEHLSKARMFMSHRRRRMVAAAKKTPAPTIAKSQAALSYLASLIVEVEYLTLAACLAYVGVLYCAVPAKAFLALSAGTVMGILLFKTIADFLQAYAKQQWKLVQRNGLVSYVPKTVRPLLDPLHGKSLHDFLSTAS
jgi:hypothetical protein